VGLLTPTLCRFAHARDGVIIEVLCINDALDLLTPVGDPVAGIGGQEEGDEHIHGAGVGGVLDELGHGGCPVYLLILPCLRRGATNPGTDSVAIRNVRPQRTWNCTPCL